MFERRPKEEVSPLDLMPNWDVKSTKWGQGLYEIRFSKKTLEGLGWNDISPIALWVNEGASMRFTIYIPDTKLFREVATIPLLPESTRFKLKYYFQPRTTWLSCWDGQTPEQIKALVSEWRDLKTRELIDGCLTHNIAIDTSSDLKSAFLSMLNVLVKHDAKIAEVIKYVKANDFNTFLRDDYSVKANPFLLHYGEWRNKKSHIDATDSISSLCAIAEVDLN